MKNRVLVSYATRAGSTREVAEYIAKVLREAGEVVDIEEAQAVRDVRPYTHVILGTGIRAGSLFPEVVQFARRFRSYLQNIETSYFVVCLTMKEDTPENRQTVEGYLKPLVEIKTPVSTGLFAGVVAYDKLGFVIRLCCSASPKMTRTSLKVITVTGKQFVRGRCRWCLRWHK
jgi:menaquinone-dependent protoporphyrinogen oxidase